MFSKDFNDIAEYPLLSGSTEITLLFDRVAKAKKNLFGSERALNKAIEKIQKECAHPAGFNIEVGFHNYEMSGAPFVRTGYVCGQCAKKR